MRSRSCNCNEYCRRRQLIWLALTQIAAGNCCAACDTYVEIIAEKPTFPGRAQVRSVSDLLSHTAFGAFAYGSMFSHRAS